MKIKITLLAVTSLVTIGSFGQNFKKPKYYFDDAKTMSADIGFTGQIWARYTDMNPGSLVNGVQKEGVFDVGLRRWRFTSNLVISSKARAFIQFGQNNFNYKSTKQTGAFFHDANFEYDLFSGAINKQEESKGISYVFTVGGGLFGWSGPSRYASPSVSSLLGYDAPLYQQATNGISDQFLRKLGVYAKGEVGRIEYRFALTTPMTITGVSTTPSKTLASFNGKSTSLQPQAYVKYQLKEKESVNSAYHKSTYLGEKEILAFGAGFVQQKGAFLEIQNNGDTTKANMLQLSADLFYESKLDETKKTSTTVYFSYSNYQFGHNYYRNLGVMNPSDGSKQGTIMNGAGDGFPTIGTGSVLFGQIGWLKKFDSGKALQPYVMSQVMALKAFDQVMQTFDIGLNYMPLGNQNIKFSLDYQNRPIVKGTINNNSTTSRKGMYVLQYQMSF